MRENINLPANHLRSVSSTLYLIEKSLVETEEMLLRKTDNFCYEIISDLKESDTKDILCKISLMKKKIHTLADKYQLKKNTNITSRILQARFSKIWEMLGDTYSRHLKGYGELPPEIADELDKDISSMMEIIEELIQINQTD